MGHKALGALTLQSNERIAGMVIAASKGTYKQTMKLIRITDTNGTKVPVCDVPNNLFSSMRALRFFLCTHASRIYGGIEGRTFRVCQAMDRHALCPIYVNQIVPGKEFGTMEYGESLVIE